LAIQGWRERLAHLPGRKIGFVWSGNPAFQADRRRSIPFATLRPLLDVRGVSFVSLQMGEARRALPVGDIFDASPYIADFTDTAAAIMALDLVISVDTSVVHLAGALGAKVWLLNRVDTDWRWLLGREDSIWYPSLRQFRHTATGDWAGVVARVASALTD
jgi:hypothetical protein